MKILIAGGRGFLGSALEKELSSSGHEVWILTRRRPARPAEIQWDGRSTGSWAGRLDEMDAVVNVTGYGLEHWPWTASRKRRFLQSRVGPGEALTSAIQNARHRPAAFLQISGINYYGTTGTGVADESYPAADDFLAQLSVKWEAATSPVEHLGVRRVLARSAVVLDTRGGLFPLMALPVRLWVGGPLGGGRQVVPWIHVRDAVRALRFLIEHEQARDAFNLIAPQSTSNDEFMRAVARVMNRPYWLPTPGFLLRIVLGQMSTLVLEGRASRPSRLEGLGFQFRYPTINVALADLLGGGSA
ncbi:MAG TPA: TIGR01777 family oxidoreductase [Anaerolineales bacterium]